MNSAKSKRRACHRLEQLPETRIPFLFLRGVDTSSETRPYLQSSVTTHCPSVHFFLQRMRSMIQMTKYSRELFLLTRWRWVRPCMTVITLS